jgi:hypothetical protein
MYFNWMNSSDADCATHILSCTPQLVTAIIYGYRKRGNTEMVEKMLRVRKLAAILKTKKKLERLESEL